MEGSEGEAGPGSGAGMTSGAWQPPAWTSTFLAGLIVTGSVVEAVEEAGTDFETVWAWRKEYPVFAHYWDRAVRVHRRVMNGEDFLDAVAAEGEVFE